MKPLILEYIEEPKYIDYDNSLIEYCEEQNISVIQGTKKSAIKFANLDTATMTKSEGEATDSDYELQNNLKLLMATETRTFNKAELSDSDRDFRLLQQLVDTQTLTESIEETDSDK